MFHFIFKRKLLLTNNHDNIISAKHSTAKTLLVHLLLLQRNPSSLMLFSDFSITNPSKTQIPTSSFTSSYLINSCGFCPQSALSISQNILLKSAERPDSVLKFLKIHGFSDTQITNLISKYPRILLLDPFKTLEPKFQYFFGLGMSVSILYKILSAEPRLLHFSLKNRIIPSVDFLKTFVHTNENVVLLTLRYSSILRNELNRTMAPKISVLENHGVPKSKISLLITRQPRVLARSNFDRFSEIAASVKEMGFKPISSAFVSAISVMLCLSKSNWERKVEVYSSLGWCEDDILLAFRNNPYSMATSEKKIRVLVEYFVKEMNLGPKFLSKYPSLFNLSIEKRIIPRCSVLQILMSRGFNKNCSIVRALKMAEDDFLRAFVLKYTESVPYILTMYRDKMKKAGLEIGSKVVE